jgi:hypothetical protein
MPAFGPPPRAEAVLSPFHCKRNLPDQLRVRPSSDRSGIACAAIAGWRPSEQLRLIAQLLRTTGIKPRQPEQSKPPSIAEQLAARGYLPPVAQPARKPPARAWQSFPRCRLLLLNFRPFEFRSYCPA